MAKESRGTPHKKLRRSGGIARALKLAVRHHGAGRLPDADAIYRQVLLAEPDNVTALHLSGVVAHQHGDHEAALELISRALKVDPAYADAHSNLGHVYLALGRLEEARACFAEAVFLTPSLAEAHNNLGNVLKEMGRLDDAVESYHMAVTLRPDFAEAHVNNGSALQEQGYLEEALACYRQAVALRPDYAAAHAHLGGVLRELGQADEAAESYREALRLDPGDANAQANLTGLRISALDDFEGAIGGSYRSLDLLRRSELGDGREAEILGRLTRDGLPLFRLKHDVGQADYLAEKGYDIAGLDEYRDAARAMLDRHGADGDAGAMATATREEAEALLPYLRAGLIFSMPDLPDGVLNPEKDWAELQARYLHSENEITHIDDFLAPDALAAFREFCLVSRVWPKEYANQYLGAFSDQGFISPLHLRLAQELKEKLPTLFGDHPLGRFWGFKYDSALGKGINVHADFALVNLNFWITPDEYNLRPGSGGLKVYDAPSPANWRFRAYNEEKEEIYRFLDERDAQSVNVPYRCNRAVLFNSAYFHETDEIDFAEGYESRRINITYLFGNR